MIYFNELDNLFSPQNYEILCKHNIFVRVK